MITEKDSKQGLSIFCSKGSAKQLNREGNLGPLQQKKTQTIVHPEQSGISEKENWGNGRLPRAEMIPE